MTKLKNEIKELEQIQNQNMAELQAFVDNFETNFPDIHGEQVSEAMLMIYRLGIKHGERYWEIKS